MSPMQIAAGLDSSNRLSSTSEVPSILSAQRSSKEKAALCTNCAGQQKIVPDECVDDTYYISVELEDWKTAVHKRTYDIFNCNTFVVGVVSENSNDYFSCDDQASSNHLERRRRFPNNGA